MVVVSEIDCGLMIQMWHIQKPLCYFDGTKLLKICS